MTQSVFAAAPLIPKDAIFALTAQYNTDPAAIKVNLGQGTYRDNTGQPWVLPSVLEARRRVHSRKQNHEYLPILGLPEFRKAVPKLVLGSDSASYRIASAQSLSGTGGLHLAGACIKKFSSLSPTVWIPSPTWSNHNLLFKSLGFECQSFQYYDFHSKCLDINAYRLMLRSAEPNSIIILHACAHNPTGCDPSKEQWQEIGQIMKQRQLFPLFDAAYLGFNSGNLDDDAYPIRYFVNELEMEAAVSVSFAKNMGLYGERVGCTFFVTRTSGIATNIESVLEQLQRSEVSNPPAYGAKIASTILNDEKLTEMWKEDLVSMCSRIKGMRKALYDALLANGAPGDWTHVINQSGMFSFLGLSPSVVMNLRDLHIYMADNSRISIAGLNDSNVEYVARAIAQTLRQGEKQQTEPRMSALL